MMRSLFAFGVCGLGVTAACGDVAENRAVVCGTQPIAVLSNGGFDDPTPPWVQSPVTPALLCGAPTITPDQGALAACLGGSDNAMQELSQTVALPAGATTAILRGRICIATAETDAVDRDELTIELVDGANVIATLGHWTNQQGAAACTFMNIDLSSALADDPATVTFRLRAALNATMPTSFYVDSLALTIGCD